MLKGVNNIFVCPNPFSFSDMQREKPRPRPRPSLLSLFVQLFKKRQRNLDCLTFEFFVLPQPLSFSDMQREKPPLFILSRKYKKKSLTPFYICNIC